MARKTKLEIVYRPEADRDLHGIAAYILAQWGRQQARLYLGDIRRTIERLPLTGHRQQRFEHLYPDLRRIRCGRHFIFFLIDETKVEIVRVMHERMDFSAQFG